MELDSGKSKKRRLKKWKNQWFGKAIPAAMIVLRVIAFHYFKCRMCARNGFLPSPR